MANQEERLQAVLAKLVDIQAGVDRIQAELAAVKSNNPDIADELDALESAVNALDDDVSAPVTTEPPPTV